MERITKNDASKFTFAEYRKVGTTKLSHEVLPPGQKVETLEGEYTCAEPSRLAVDAAGNVYPVAESIFLKTYVSADAPAATDGALAFLRRAADGDHRIVSSGDLTHHQIVEAQTSGLFYVEPGGGLGWAILPWSLTTTKDRKREADYFSRHGMMA